MADPELIREHMRGMGLRSAGSMSMAAVAAPTQYPLGPPTITGTTFTVDLALNNPTRMITPMVQDLTRERFFAERAFTNSGGLTGGALVYDEMIKDDLYLARDIQRVAPGTEFPIVAGERRAPKVAEVEKWGAKFFFTDEARDRNDVALFTNFVRQLSNTVVRKINQRTVEALDAAVTASSRSVAGVAWDDVVTAGATPSNYNLFPARDFAKADLVAEQEELGIDYNLWVINPNEMYHLEGIYGDRLDALLDSFDIDIFVTNRVAVGIGYALAEGQVGEMRTEKPYGTETWRDPNGKEQTWVQGSVRPLWAVNNPYAVLKFTGLNTP
jgi:hypothetical protein